jgi:hypothetical protein
MSLPGGGAILVVPGSRNGAGGASGLAVWRGARCSRWFSTTAGSLFAQVPMWVTPDVVTHIGTGQHRIVGFDGTGG